MKPTRAAIRNRRIALDLNLDDIAVEWGYCDPAAISRWERDQKKNLPAQKTAEDYAALLDNKDFVKRVLAQREAQKRTAVSK